MDSHQVALLIAVALPIALVAGLNLFLALTGERDTLLLPLPRSLTFGEPLAVLDRARAAAQVATQPADGAPLVPEAVVAQAEPAAAELAAATEEALREAGRRPKPAAHPAISALRRFLLDDEVVRT